MIYTQYKKHNINIRIYIYVLIWSVQLKGSGYPCASFCWIVSLQVVSEHFPVISLTLFC